jgi:hypothetical protein
MVLGPLEDLDFQGEQIVVIQAEAGPFPEKLKRPVWMIRSHLDGSIPPMSSPGSSAAEPDERPPKCTTQSEW